jgi:D-aminopeptidase
LTRVSARGAKPLVDFEERRIDAIFADLNQCQLPGAAVGIAIGGRPVYRKGFGLANLELPVLLSSRIRMRIGSITKHFTALAYMLLCEEGRASLDDPIGKHLPELHSASSGVTARQLMGHISGLRDATGIRWQFSGNERAIPSAELLSLYRTIDDVNFPPGASWGYNNGGYLLLSAAIERIAHQPLEELFRTRIFEPIGMHATVLRRLDTDFVPNSATMHATSATGTLDRSYLAGAFAGEGGIVSTVDDMLRWMAHMDAPVVGSPATWATIRTPQALANGTSTGYGFGLVSGEFRGARTLYHSGGLRGANAHMVKVPEARLDVVIMVNRDDALGVVLADEILAACLPDLEPVRIKEGEQMPVAAGVFRSPVTGRIAYLSGEGAFVKTGQQVVSIDGAGVPFEPDSDGVLRPTSAFSHLKRTVTLIGDRLAPTALLLNDFGRIDELVAVPPAPNADATAIAGEYVSVSTGTVATLSSATDGPRLNTVGRCGTMAYDLGSLAEGIWRAKWRGTQLWSAILSFSPDAREFRFSTTSTRALPFRRRGR